LTGTKAPKSVKKGLTLFRSPVLRPGVALPDRGRDPMLAAG
jgi:hypothetical protein